MAQWKVKTPVPGFSGMRAGVHFARGEAVVDDADEKQARALAYFQRRGYTVTAAEVEQPEAKPAKKTTATRKPRGGKQAEPPPAAAGQEPEGGQQAEQEQADDAQEAPPAE